MRFSSRDFAGQAFKFVVNEGIIFAPRNPLMLPIADNRSGGYDECCPEN